MPGEHPVVRLAAAAAGAPYFASSVVLPRWVPRHSLDHAEIVAITGGRGRLGMYDGRGEIREYPLGPGSMFFIRPSEQFRYTSPAGDLSAVYVSFAFAEWQTFAVLAGLGRSWATSPEPPRATFDPAKGEAVPFHEALRRFRLHPTNLDLMSFWLQVGPRLFPGEDSARSRRERPPEWLSRSLESMRGEENLREGLPRFARIAHVSPSYLAACTRRYLGASPGALVRGIRLRHAALLIGTTTESFGAIALRCGFENYPSFTTAFRSEFQVSPREYRRRAHLSPEASPGD